MWVDSHCHLQLAGGDEHVERARAAGVEWMVCVGTDLETSRKVIYKALDLGINLIDSANSYGNQARFDRAGAPPVGNIRL